MTNFLTRNYLGRLIDPWRNSFFRVVNTENTVLNTEKGLSRVASHRIQGFSDGSVVYYAVRTNSDEPTVVSFNMNVEGKVRVDLFEDADVTISGDPQGGDILDSNLNRISGEEFPNVEVLPDVTVDVEGTRIATGGAGGRRVVGQTRPVPATVLGSPWVLDTDTTYVYRVENVSGDSIDLNPTLGYTTRSLPEL